MSHVTDTPTETEQMVREKIMEPGPEGDAVRASLASSHARTDAELRLAALVIAFGFGALDALGKAVDPELSLNQVLRLRSNATALSRAGHQNQAVLNTMESALKTLKTSPGRLADQRRVGSMMTLGAIGVQYQDRRVFCREHGHGLAEHLAQRRPDRKTHLNRPRRRRPDRPALAGPAQARPERACGCARCSSPP